MPTENSRPRGRPRRFDPEQAIATAQHLFRARGYDAVSVADITEVLGINPPSFYAAFGNKTGLFARVLDHYADTDAIPLSDILRTDRPVAECLAEVLEESARRYATRSGAAGCLALEGLHSNDPDVREIARAANAAAEELVRSYIAERHLAEAERLADFVCTTMVGLSAKSRNGYGLERLLATARLAGSAIAQALPAGS